MALCHLVTWFQLASAAPLFSLAVICVFIFQLRVFIFFSDFAADVIFLHSHCNFYCFLWIPSKPIFKVHLFHKACGFLLKSCPLLQASPRACTLNNGLFMGKEPGALCTQRPGSAAELVVLLLRSRLNAYRDHSHAHALQPASLPCSWSKGANALSCVEAGENGFTCSRILVFSKEKGNVTCFNSKFTFEV